MPKYDIPIKNLRFYGETTNDGVKTLQARHEPQHLVSAEVKEHIIEYVVKVGEGENAAEVIMHATIQGTRAFKRALLETLVKVLQAREMVLKAMVEVGVLPQNARDEELIYFLSLSDYSQEVATLKPPKKRKVEGKAKKKHENRKPLSSTTLFEPASATTEAPEKVNNHHPAVTMLLPVLLFLLGLLLGYFIF